MLVGILWPWTTSEITASVADNFTVVDSVVSGTTDTTSVSWGFYGLLADFSLTAAASLIIISVTDNLAVADSVVSGITDTTSVSWGLYGLLTDFSFVSVVTTVLIAADALFSGVSGWASYGLLADFSAVTITYDAVAYDLKPAGVAVADALFSGISSWASYGLITDFNFISVVYDAVTVNLNVVTPINTITVSDGLGAKDFVAYSLLAIQGLQIQQVLADSLIAKFDWTVYGLGSGWFVTSTGLQDSVAINLQITTEFNIPTKIVCVKSTPALQITTIVRTEPADDFVCV